ncbi:T9SS type A sorting domain-containing protein [Gaetbulibacter sp. M235]|uniref:T9SS type A sorting domain-containing protein n=1 Tax=Gaetbulibacter sp. M235 TaxID=3126510 RepID=UPI00374E2E5D
MKTKIIILIGLIFFSSEFLYAQTDGTLTFNFTQGSPANTADGGVVLAVWIQNGTTFVKTNNRYLSNGTKDHLPIFGAKAGWTTVNNSMTANVVDAITGATRKSGTTPAALGPYSITWNGTDVNGSVVADGTYTVWYEATWTDGSSNTHDFVNTGFAFTKGTSITTTNPGNVGPLSAMTITWTPTALSLDSVYKTKVSIYPNPSNGIINVLYDDIPVSKINVVNIFGQVVKSIKIDPSKSKKSQSIDLSDNANGIYIINVSTNETSSSYKVLLNN